MIGNSCDYVQCNHRQEYMYNKMRIYNCRVLDTNIDSTFSQPSPVSAQETHIFRNYSVYSFRKVVHHRPCLH